MHTENLITEDDTTEQELSEENKQDVSHSPFPQNKKKKKHNSALLAVAKARSEAIHKTANSFTDGLHPIGTNITYKDGGGVL